MNKLDVQDKPKFEKMFSNKVLSDFSKNPNDRGSNPKLQKGRNGYPPKDRPTFCKYCKKHANECLVGSIIFYGCGMGGHMVKDCLNVRSPGKGDGQSERTIQTLEDMLRDCVIDFS